MKFGANTFIWRSPFFTMTDLDLNHKVKEFDFDFIEIADESTALIELKSLKSAFEHKGMKAIMGGVYGSDRNLSSLDAKKNANTVDYLKWRRRTPVMRYAKLEIVFLCTCL